MIKNIGWTLGNDCPCKCKHCYSFSVRQKEQNLTKEIVDKVIEQIEKLNVETVNLGGNEPIFTNGLDVKKSMLPYILKAIIISDVIDFSKEVKEYGLGIVVPSGEKAKRLEIDKSTYAEMSKRAYGYSARNSSENYLRIIQDSYWYEEKRNNIKRQKKRKTNAI